MLIPCPFAQWNNPPHTSTVDRRPSFSIQINPGGASLYKCWTCEATGDVVSMLRQLVFLTDGNSLLKKAVTIAESYDRDPVKLLGLSRENQKQRAEDKEKERVRKISLLEEVKNEIKTYIGNIPQYALDQGLTLETCAKWWLGYDKKRNRLVYPVLDDTGKFVGAQGRALDEEAYPKYLNYAEFDRGLHLHGAHVAAPYIKAGQDKKVLVVEGPKDVCRTWQNGVPWVVGVMGKSITPEQRNLLIKWGVMTVYFALDADPAGDLGFSRSLDICRDRFLMKQVKLPDEEDPADQTELSLKRCLAEAKLVY